MLMADSLLVYTSGRRRKTAHCPERLLCNATEEEEEEKEEGEGCCVSVTKGTALRESPDVHM